LVAPQIIVIDSDIVGIHQKTDKKYTYFFVDVSYRYYFETKEAEEPVYALFSVDWTWKGAVPNVAVGDPEATLESFSQWKLFKSETREKIIFKQDLK